MPATAAATTRDVAPRASHDRIVQSRRRNLRWRSRDALRLSRVRLHDQPFDRTLRKRVALNAPPCPASRGAHAGITGRGPIRVAVQADAIGLEPGMAHRDPALDRVLPPAQAS